MQEELETLQILRGLPGGDELIAWFGGHPNFGDAEVKTLTLDRTGNSKLVLCVIARSDGRRRGAHVVFHLKDMIDLKIEGFAHQNVIGGLALRRALQSDVHPSLIGIGAASGELEIILEPCAGAFGTIRATSRESALR